MLTQPVTSLTNLHIRASMVSPFNSARALSKPNRVLAPPAITYPFTMNSPMVEIRSASQIGPTRFANNQKLRNQLLLFQRFAPRPSDPQLAQLFLQALSMETDRCRRARNIPTMRGQLLQQIGHFELPLGFAKVPLAHSVIRLVPVVFQRDCFSLRRFRRQILYGNFFLAAEHHAALQGVLQFPYIARPIVFLDGGQRLAAQPQGSPHPGAVHFEKSFRQQSDVALVR